MYQFLLDKYYSEITAKIVIISFIIFFKVQNSELF